MAKASESKVSSHTTEEPVYLMHLENAEGSGRSYCADLPFTVKDWEERGRIPLEMCIGCLMMVKGLATGPVDTYIKDIPFGEAENTLSSLGSDPASNTSK